MMETVEVPIWLMLLVLLLAIVAALDKIMIPSVRWFFRRRLERAVARLNERLARPIQPFKLARRHDMIQRVIYDPQVGHAAQSHARRAGVPEGVAFELARRYAREIVPRFSAFAYFGLAIRAARFLSNSLYDVRLRYVDRDALRSIDEDATVVFVMNHRSNMDYVLVTYLAADQSALAYAVGEWARVWPLSGLIRAMGAYFIRRKSRDELYRQVLSCYVRRATEAGVTQAMFPEGGLSLSGGLCDPKVGLLKYMVSGLDPDGPDVVFVPVGLNYDRVLEDTILIAAADKHEHRFRARIGVIANWMVKQVWLKLRGRHKRFGRAAVHFGEPLSLRSFQQTQGSDFVVPLAEELMNRIGKAVPILPVPVVAWMLQTRDGPVPVRDVNELYRQTNGITSEAARSDIATELHEAIDQLVSRKLVRRDGEHILATGERGALLAYYAASIAHLPVLNAAGASWNAAPAGS